MAASNLVLIIDFGSQYTQLIARRIRESRVYCEIVSCSTPTEQILARKPRALVLSGGPSSVYAEDAPPFDPALLHQGLPVLGICYGVQLMAHRAGGRVERADRREYGPA
ncbi:MAG: gamma-glutamyl-gamma-aminobutyrate hydrolase family protein, partial [Polyangiaceae bacterium]|nr:gamma-glutamyl-gamma-aminobutyrate hydrolase family protein [Polyangiaceae bacterium]